MTCFSNIRSNDQKWKHLIRCRYFDYRNYSTDMTHIVTFKQISEFIYASDNNLSNLISWPFSYLYIRLSLITSIFLTLLCNKSETLSFYLKAIYMPKPFYPDSSVLKKWYFNYPTSQNKQRGRLKMFQTTSINLMLIEY